MVPVVIRALSKSYDGTTPVLDGVDLDIAAGEMFFLLGASGCGKTTLLRMVAGFLRADHGSIHFADRDVTTLPAEQRGIGMVFQNYALWPHLSVHENVRFGLDVRKVSSAEKRQRVDEALALVELSGFGHRRISELSGGQQQRVALARAIVIRPHVLLLDEPLSNLDARLRTQMRAEIRRVCKASGLTAIYVTHDQAEALSTADRVALMHAGRIIQVGTPRELYEQPSSRAVAEFVGDANLLPATVIDSQRLRCALGELSAAIPSSFAPGAQVTACIRPERVRLLSADSAEGNAGIITAASYVGAHAQWQVRVGETLMVVNEATPPPRAIGDHVRVAVPDSVVALPH